MVLTALRRHGFIRQSFLEVSPGIMEFGFAPVRSRDFGTGGHGRNSSTIDWRGLMFGSGAFFIGPDRAARAGGLTGRLRPGPDIAGGTVISREAHRRGPS
jgi:hypothetical protein